MMRFKVLISVTVCIAVLTSCQTFVNTHYDPHKAHHQITKFRNTQVPENMKRRGMMRWLTDLLAASDEQNYRPQIMAVDMERIHRPDPDIMQVTWIGHATFLVQVSGKNILLDPVFSDRASPFPFFGPKRWAPPAIVLKYLPPIDAVMISHNHYDHLDVETIRMLGDVPMYFVPLGLKHWFRDKGIDPERVTELDWWESAKLDGFNMTFVPAQHFSGRMILDLNRSLWGGWVVSNDKHNLYYAGDTGYNNLQFKQIGARLGPFDLSVIPIGAYEPEEILKKIHVSPKGAVKIHKDVKSKQSIAAHWGTFRLTIEPMAEPSLYLERVLKEQNIPLNEFRALKFGETITVQAD